MEKRNHRFDDADAREGGNPGFAEHERDRVAEGERGHDLDDPPQGRPAAGIPAPTPARRDERGGEDQGEQGAARRWSVPSAM